MRVEIGQTGARSNVSLSTLWKKALWLLELSSCPSPSPTSIRNGLDTHQHKNQSKARTLTDRREAAADQSAVVKQGGADNRAQNTLEIAEGL